MIELLTNEDVIQNVEDGGQKPVSADAVLAALENIEPAGKIELVYNGTDIRYDGELVNFAQIVEFITEDSRFTYLIYNSRVLLTSDMSLEGGTRYIFFETSTTDGAVSKNAVVKVYSANGIDISSISYSTTANENVNNKVAELTDRNKSSENSYPSNKAVSDYVDALSNKIDTDITELEQNIANKADKTQTEQSISNIQNQVNNLITPVTQDAEVQNARVGADGHSYSTLKERLDTEQTSVKEDLSDLNCNSITRYTKHKGNMSNNGTWNNINNAYQHIVVPVSQGDIFALSTVSGTVQIGFLKSYNEPTDGGMIPFSEAQGFTGKITYGTNRKTVQIPADVLFVVIEIIYNNIEVQIAQVTINGYDISKSLRNIVEGIVTDVDFQKQSIDSIATGLESVNTAIMYGNYIIPVHWKNGTVGNTNVGNTIEILDYAPYINTRRYQIVECVDDVSVSFINQSAENAVIFVYTKITEENVVIKGRRTTNSDVVLTRGRYAIGFYIEGVDDLSDYNPDDYLSISYNRSYINDIKASIDNINITMLNSVKQSTGLPMITKKWGQFDETHQYKHSVIRVESGQTIELIGSQERNSYIGFLTDYSVPVEGENVNYSAVEGYTDRLTLERATRVKYVVPADSKYLYIVVVYDNTITMPSMCKIDKLDYSKSLGNIAISDAITDVIDDSVYDVITKVFSDTGYTFNVDWFVGTFSQDVGSKSHDMPNNIRQRTEMQKFPVPVMISCDAAYGFNVVLYDEDEYMTGYASGQGYLNQPVEIQANQNFRLVMANQNKSTDISGIDASDYVFVKFNSNMAVNKKMQFKWCAMGDSITQGYISRIGEPPYVLSQTDAWAYKLQKMTGWELTNIAIGGTGYIRNHPDTSDAGWNVAKETDFSEFDFVTLAYGVNDWKYNCQLGTFNDDYETPTTMYGAMRSTIESIIASNPYCKIFMISPVNCSVGGNEAGNWGIGYPFSNNGTLEDIFNAEKTVAEYYGIEFIDMTHSSIINRKNIHTCLIDNVHPTAEAHTVMAREIGARIGWLF